MKKIKTVVAGACTGFLNGLLGAGGGMIVVPILKTEIDTKKAHATSVAIILPICLVSGIIYILQEKVTIMEALPFAPFGLIGALIGTKFLQKLNNKIIKRIFALLMLWAGIRLLLK